MITYIDILSSEEIAKACEIITNLRPVWIDRGQLPSFFFTLGAASYLDVTQSNIKSYKDKSQQYNLILENHFGWLYSLVTKALEETLQAKTYFDPELALPGFHIWLAPAIFVKPNASIHFDLQYRYLRWEAREIADFTKLFSFTLPIRLPKAGGGLNTWDISHDKYVALYREKKVSKVEELLNLAQMTFYPYSIGTLVLHSGTKLHQIAPVNNVDRSDARITLQGHGVWCNNRWLLYW